MDIQSLKDQVSITEVLEYYGWEDDYGLRGWGEWQKTRCPFHLDEDPSASVNVDRGYFRCFVCGTDDRAHDIIDIVMEQEVIDDVREAVRWIENRFLPE